MGIHQLREWAKVAGSWMRFTISARDDVDDHDGLIMVIPGNPGNDGFYTQFCQDFLEKTKETFRVVTISHLNHVPLPLGLEKLNPIQAKQRFTLNDQVDHAYDFFCQVGSKLVSEKKVVLVGHSIGAYICAVLKGRLERDGYEVDLVGLFPTLQGMADSPAGQKMGPLVRFVSNHPRVTRFLTMWLKWLPHPLKRGVVRLFVRDTDDCVIEAAAELLDDLVLRNVGFMASDELDHVHQLNPKVEIELSKGQVHLYYGLNDHWVPLEYAKEMAKQIGKERVIYDDTGAEHAFVVRDSAVIAGKVSSLVS